MKKLILVYLLICSSCIVIQKTNSGAIINNPRGIALQNKPLSIPKLLYNRVAYEQYTLDLTLINKKNGNVVNIHLDNNKSFGDSILLYGTSIDFTKENKVRFEILLSSEDLNKFSFTEVDFPNQTLPEEYNFNDKLLYNLDTLNDYITQNSPFNVQIIDNSTLSDAVKVYSGKIGGKNNIIGEFYATTDPLPLILILPVAATALYCSYYKADNKCKKACEKRNGKSIYHLSLSIRDFKLECICNNTSIPY